MKTDSYNINFVIRRKDIRRIKKILLENKDIIIKGIWTKSETLYISR